MAEPRLAIDHGDVRIWQGDAAACLRAMPPGIAQTVVTSPPFWALRDYGTGTWQGGDPDHDHDAYVTAKAVAQVGTTGSVSPGSEGQIAMAKARHTMRGCTCGAVMEDEQIGMEATPDEWVARLVDVFQAVRRVLRDDGTVWLEVGDTYASNPANGGPPSALLDGPQNRTPTRPWQRPPGAKPKDLVGAPWLLAFALRADGWWLRSDVIWHRPNPMPESTTDRPTKAHSYVFLLTKKPRYFYDAEAIAEPTVKPGGVPVAVGTQHKQIAMGRDLSASTLGAQVAPAAGRNARSVWTITTEASEVEHYATFPRALVSRCIRAGTSEHGACPSCGAPWARVIDRPEVDTTRSIAAAQQRIDATGGLIRGGTERSTLSAIVPERTTTGWAPTCRCHDPRPVVPQLVLDPFMGSGTTAMIARRMGRHSAGCELSPEYVDIARGRLAQLGLLTGDVTP